MLHPAVGAPRRVGLCELCHRNRPGRHGEQLLDADIAWRNLHRDASGLLARYRVGTWYAPPGIPYFAGDVARLVWTENTLRTAPRIARDTGLVNLIERAITVLKAVPADDQALLPLRQLIDVLAHAPCSLVRVNEV